MDEDSRTPQSASPQRAARVPYRRSTPHITQEPITDDALKYRQRVHPGTYPDPAQSQRDPYARQAADAHQPAQDPRALNTEQAPEATQPRPGRRHMGVATADPQYLPPTGPAHPRRTPQPGEERPRLHYERYLQGPSGRKSIFTSRQERERRRLHLLVALLVILAIVGLVLWLVL
ncbi:hypothetical protein [Enorma phocaeensis]|uniref:hypothetical protein n=1 Tax=Enorma phocaeensis TaxID=1871019 RepID=UPI0032092308